jgi:hypothetical protein
MGIEVVVPWRPGCHHRERAWRWVHHCYERLHPTWQITEARAPEGEWCKAGAVNPALDRSEAEIVILADADCWCDGLIAAVEAIRDGAGWAVPHLHVHRLSEGGTAAVLEGADWCSQAFDQQPYRGVLGGGMVVARREHLLEAPIDPRFIGWGQEDEAHALALNALFGQPWRGTADLIHLYHPPQDRQSRRRGSKASWDLRRRYASVRRQPNAMRSLLEEARCHSPA